MRAESRSTGRTVTDTNAVHLVGRVAADPQPRELPSGVALVAFRVAVARPARRTGRPAADRQAAAPQPAAARQPAAAPHRAAAVDTIDCAAWTAAARGSAAALVAGDVVEVEGALRRRFWRTPGGPASRYEVEVSRVRQARASAGGAPGARPTRGQARGTAARSPASA